MKKNKKLILINLVLAGLLSGCAGAPNVSAPKSFWQNKNQQVDIAKMPSSEDKASFYSVGDQGILDLAITESLNKSTKKILSQYDAQKILVNARTLFLSELEKHHIKTRIVDAIDASKLPESHAAPAQYSTKDYQGLSKKYGNNRLLTLTIDKLGEQRMYYSVFPSGSPYAICEMTGRLINLKNNRIIWRYTVSASGVIKKPFTNQKNLFLAINQAAQNATQDLANNFVMNAKNKK